MASANKPVDDLVALAHARYREAAKHTTEWREQVRESYDFYSGEQWSTEDRQALEEQQRPPATFNRIARAVNAVVGMQIGNRQEITYKPRTTDDSGPNEVISGGAGWVRDQCQAEEKETDAFTDTVIGGVGWIETRLDYDIDQDGMIVYERVDPGEMAWDPRSKMRNFADAQWLMRVRDIDRDRFEELWPDANIGEKAPWDEQPDENLSTREHVLSQNAYEREQGKSDGSMSTVKVAQMQWVDFEMVWRVGNMAETMSDEDYRRLADKLKSRNIKAIKQKKRIVRQAFFSGNEILEQGLSPARDYFTFHAITGFRDRNNGTWLGLIEGMKEPQRWGNKFFSVMIDIFNKNSKGGIIIEKTATDDIVKLQNEWARPDGVTVVNAGAVSSGRIQPKPVGAMPAGMDKMMAFALENVNDIVGVSAEMLGIVQRNQPGVLEYQRKQAGLTVLAPLFDSLRQYHITQGKVLLAMMKLYMNDGRLVRIVQGGGLERYVPLVFDPSVTKFDVIVEEAPTSPNQKDRVWSMMGEMIPVALKSGLPIPPEILDYSPLPTPLVQQWKQMLANQGPKIPPEVQQKLGELSQENQQLKDKKAESAAEMQRKQFETTETLKLKQATAEAEFALKSRIAELELMLEERKQAGDAALAQAKMQNDAQLKERQLHVDAHQKMLETTGKPEANVVDDISIRVAQAVAPAVAQVLAQIMAAPRVKRVEVKRGRTGLIEAANVIETPEFPTPQGNA